jgi:hypothetical protein
MKRFSRWTMGCLTAGVLGTLAACGGGGGGSNGNQADAGVDAAPPNYAALPPVLGVRSSEPLDCAGAYELPTELTGPDGLGHHGWSLEDLTFQRSWPVPSAFPNAWLSDNLDTAPSLRVRPWLVPEAGACYQQGLAARSAGAAVGTPVLGAVLEHMTAFSHSHTAYDALVMDRYTPHGYDLSEPTVLVRVLRGLWELPNQLPDAPQTAAWDDNVHRGLPGPGAAGPGRARAGSGRGLPAQVGGRGRR